MTLVVASPTSSTVWRDPRLMTSSPSGHNPSHVHHHPVTASAVATFVPHPMSPTSSVAVKPDTSETAMASLVAAGGAGGGLKVEDEGDLVGGSGQDILCVVCTDKSSGKHYGQFTCEGERRTV